MKTLAEFQQAYAAGGDTQEILRRVWETIRDEPDKGIFITKAGWDDILKQLREAPVDGKLFGIPYAVKDNIDVAGMPTTAACPDYSYLPEESATAVKLLQAAGAICFGKTNLDQFATGLVGVRTPYPVPKNAFDEKYLPGGSSCGSAIAVAKELVPFSLGTDTAGSGRVPAAFNELIGLKPTRGFVSTRGVVDACKSLDCISVFANSCADADAVLGVTAKLDCEEAWSRTPPHQWKRFGEGFRFGIPRPKDLQYFGWDDAGKLFEAAKQAFVELGGEAVEVDIQPFLAAARLLYEGPWVAERYVGIKDFLATNPDSVFPVTREIIEKGEFPKASELFEAKYKLAECKRLADREMAGLDFVMLPTVPRNFTLEEVSEEPVKLNSVLGTYTNFMNLLDYSALALPAGRYQQKLPWGVTLFAEPAADRALLELGARYERRIGREVPEISDVNFDAIEIVVCGAHLEGMSLNWQLTERGGRLVSKGRTADCYRMYLIPEGNRLPERPALIRVNEDGVQIAVEVWSLGIKQFGDFVSKIPAPLGVGKVLLADGREKCGFIAEPRATIGARDLSEFGGWAGYLNSIRP
ncbi:allophanate hydrolase [Luteolibacter algae]|uniref:Allophanate hydrolase n=1 Tax=Luteolibacter algae TaxID=454151 RepID=A0ABW5D9D3_9BACT